MPAMTWLTRREMLSHAIRALNNAPVATPVKNPSQRLPVAAAAENPQTDAISMVPSTPRFKMPALCV